MTSYNVIVEGRNFFSQRNSSQSRVGFFVTINVKSIDDLQTEVLEKLKLMISGHNKNQDFPLLWSEQSYLRITHIFEIIEGESPGGFSIYRVSTISFYVSLLQYHAFRMLVRLNVINSLKSPVRMDV